MPHGSTQVFQPYALVDRYQKRTKDKLGDVCLADFAALNSSTLSKKETVKDDEDVDMVVDEIDKEDLQLSKRSEPRVLRFNK